MGAEAMKAITSTKPIANASTQKAHRSPASRFLRMSCHTSSERTVEQELYRIVSALSDAITLASRLAISDVSNTITRSGELAWNTTTLVNIAAASTKLMPAQTDRVVEPALSI